MTMPTNRDPLIKKKKPKMQPPLLALLAATAAALVALAATTTGAWPQLAAAQDEGGWVEGRATWYQDNQQGACHYYSSIPEFYAAFSDSNAPGDGAADNSCGLCYEVQCVPGTVVDRWGTQLSRWDTCRSSEGWGGGGGAGREEYPPTALVKIVDMCPCVHSNYASNQRWCCGDVPHIDLGEAAFAHLADRAQGVVRARWRRADCGRGNGPVLAME